MLHRVCSCLENGWGILRSSLVALEQSVAQSWSGPFIPGRQSRHTCLFPEGPRMGGIFPPEAHLDNEGTNHSMGGQHGKQFSVSQPTERAGVRFRPTPLAHFSSLTSLADGYAPETARTAQRKP